MEKEQLLTLEKEIKLIESKYMEVSQNIKTKQDLINERETIILESEKAYDNLLDKSSQVLTLLKNETDMLRNKLKNP